MNDTSPWKELYQAKGTYFVEFVCPLSCLVDIMPILWKAVLGASSQADGDSGIHTHMTHTLNTPIEALGTCFPVRVKEYRLRRGSGGQRKNRGGDGIIRSLEMLTDCQVTILSERRRYAPYGLRGGSSGKTGHNYLVVKGQRKKLPGKFSLSLSKGDLIVSNSPGEEAGEKLTTDN